MFPVFSPCVINLSRNKNICCGLTKVFAKSRTRVYFEQKILALLLVFHQNHNLSRIKFSYALANQPIIAPHFCNPQQMFLLLKVDPRSTFGKKFRLPTTNVFVARQVEHAKLKRGNIDQSLQRNNVAQQVEGFCISYFAALKWLLIVLPLHAH